MESIGSPDGVRETCTGIEKVEDARKGKKGKDQLSYDLRLLLPLSDFLKAKGGHLSHEFNYQKQ